jgi:hypothetical protein
MSPADDRGSTKLLHELFGGKVPESHEEVARALGVKADSVKLLRWWVKGTPRPDWFHASFRVHPDLVGDVVGRLIKGGYVVDGFPFGLPAIDAAIINVSNVPHEVRG